MSLSRRKRWLAALAVSVLAVSFLAVAAAPVSAQRVVRRSPFGAAPVIPQPRIFMTPVNPNAPFNSPQTAQQFLFNSAVMGRAIRNIPPDVRALSFGANPYAQPVIATSPAVFSSPYMSYGGLGYSGISPYSLSTVSPSSACPAGATLSTSPYSLSTTSGASLGSYGGYGGGGYGGGGYGGYGYSNIQGDITAGATLNGLANYTQAYGQYLINSQKGSLEREKVRQEKFDTYRKSVLYQQWYESMRLTSNQMRQREWQTDIQKAREFAPAVEIYSAKSLNDLLKSAIKTAGPNNLGRGPQIELTDINLNNVHVSNRDGGNIGLLLAEKDQKLVMNWPAVLLDKKKFETWPAELTTALTEAVASLRQGEAPSNAKLQDIDNLVAKMKAKLNEPGAVDDMSPVQFSQAHSYMRQVVQAVKALRSPNAKNYFNDTWKAKGRTVSELVDNMQKNGLEFAAASPGDEAAYTALYQALRAYEGGLQVAMSTPVAPPK